jgi:uncharacterized protein
LQRQRLIVFTKYPTPGLAKTRLIPHLGADRATQLHRRLTEHTLLQAHTYSRHHPCCLEVRYTGGDRALMQAWLGRDLAYTLQGDGDLGDRMARAVSVAFSQRADAVVIIGTDCPGMTPERISDAFSKLQFHDLVLGSAYDGGYYLIGLRSLNSEQYLGLFEEMTWSTDQVFRETCDRAQRLQLSTALLPALPDIDRPEDLQYLPSHLQL